MSGTAEAEVNPDGSTTFDESTKGDSGDAGSGDGESSTFEAVEIDDRTDPAIYLGIAVLVIGVIYICYILYRRRKQKSNRDMDFFSEIDGEKFNLKLPAAVDEYYEVKAKCEDQGWVPGEPPKNPEAAANGPHRVMAQALMKRCIADIPLVQHVQKESSGMNKLYSQSMCSVKQWRSYQNAEAMVSGEVEEVRAEADEIEPGWSQVIWRQAMQYHQMLKQRHEMEAKNMAAQAEKKRIEEAKVQAEKKKEADAKARVVAAEKAAQDLIKQEEREKASKSSFSSNNNGMKKGFLNSGSKKSK
eukprot:CAMPEP_0195527824 /NCGR_PEP_ID=MMETSP0794_2-20130614/29744_1 /TAXON_ID=515487 /ORGANISM="Stephanopyxis turris, Strain CCMP 815" /LENGTH=300 /DNA_ID=CAMNT_0040658825 /DNA_START=131 /DNA_END=1033 /DNA_ORIENTATION=+